MSRNLLVRLGAIPLLLLLTTAAVGQAQATPEVPMNLDGQVSFGYAGGSGSGGTMSNGMFVGTSANLNGYVRDPRILKFDVAPNYIWNDQGNGAATAISGTNSQGVYSHVDFLSGSWMPLSFQYSFQRTNASSLSQGELPVTLSSTGTSNDFNVNWFINRHKKYVPTFGIGYDWGTNNSSFTGLSQSDSGSHHSGLNLTSSDSLLGFNMAGTYSYSQSHQQTADILNLGISPINDMNATSERLTVDRSLPATTRLSTQFAHETSTYNISGVPHDLSFDLASASVTSTPIDRLTLNFGTDYNSNVSADLLSHVVTPTDPGSVTPTLPADLIASGRAFDVTGSVGYNVGHGLFVQGTGFHQVSNVLNGEQVVTDQYGGAIMYNRPLFHGTLGLSYTPAYDIFHLSMLGQDATAHALSQGASVTYSRRAGRWMNQGSVSYSSTSISEELLIPVVTRAISGSFRSSTRLHRQWNFSWFAVASQNRVPGTTGSDTELGGIQVSNRTWAFTAQQQRNGGYSIVNGAAIANIAANAAESNLLPDIFRTNGSGSTVSTSYNRRALSIVGSFNHSSVTLNALQGPIVSSSSNFDTRVTYRFRKVDVQGGYRWYSQMATSNNLLDLSAQTFWISVIRQFHFF
jgi:hypothetical protein